MVENQIIFYLALLSHFPDESATVPGPQPFLPVRLGFPECHGARSHGAVARPNSSPARRLKPGTAPLSSRCHNGRMIFMEKPMGLFGGWRLIDTAPLDTDVTLLVTDGGGEPYRNPHPCKRTATGWASSRKGTPLAVTPLQWKPYNPPRK
jgi:hypothetical protein